MLSTCLGAISLASGLLCQHICLFHRHAPRSSLPAPWETNERTPGSHNLKHRQHYLAKCVRTRHLGSGPLGRTGSSVSATSSASPTSKDDTRRSHSASHEPSNSGLVCLIFYSCLPRALRYALPDCPFHAMPPNLLYFAFTVVICTCFAVHLCWIVLRTQCVSGAAYE